MLEPQIWLLLVSAITGQTEFVVNFPPLVSSFGLCWHSAHKHTARNAILTDYFHPLENVSHDEA